jgi:hypothetical protein
MRSNCIFWALRRYAPLLREWRRAGRPEGRAPHLVFRPSELEPWWVFHWQVEHLDAGSATWVRQGFVPLDKSPLRWWQVRRALWFAGEVRTVAVDLRGMR